MTFLSTSWPYFIIILNCIGVVEYLVAFLIVGRYTFLIFIPFISRIGISFGLVMSLMLLFPLFHFTCCLTYRSTGLSIPRVSKVQLLTILTRPTLQSPCSPCSIALSPSTAPSAMLSQALSPNLRSIADSRWAGYPALRIADAPSQSATIPRWLVHLHVLNWYSSSIVSSDRLWYDCWDSQPLPKKPRFEDCNPPAP